VDIIRDTRPQKKRRSIWVAAAVAGLVAATLFFRSLDPAAPTVEAATIWRDTVREGTLIRQIRGPGTLVPEQARFITAVTNGRVERIQLLPGAQVEAGDVILEMSNPDVNMELLQAQTQLSQAQAALLEMGTDIRTRELEQEGTLATTRTRLAQAVREYETNQRLFDTNPDLVARAELDRTREVVEELEIRLDLEERRLAVIRESLDDQLAAQALQVDRLQAQVQFNQDRLASLVVRAPYPGLLSPLAAPLQEGQWVLSGQELARIVVPGRLKAEVRIPQTQAQEVAVGQVALVDTRSDTIQGTVTRIDPAVRQGTVTIDVSLPTPLPASARPDLSVDGNVIIEQLDDVVYVGRPTFGQANQRVSLFRVTPDGAYAERVTVVLGASSVNEIEIREGLAPGDVVILSDMSRFDGFDRVRIN
jgi:multidrug resistance efflux pump